MNSKKRKNGLLAYRFEISFEISRKRILPKFDLLGRELGPGYGKRLGSNVDVLFAKVVCEMNKGQGNIIEVEIWGGKLSVRRGCKVDLNWFHTVVTAVDIPGVGITQLVERA